MVLTRRALIAAAPLLLSGVARASAVALRLEAAGEAMVALTAAGIRQPLLLPAQGARLLPGLACGGEQLGLVGFAQAADGAVLEWVALVLVLDGSMALVALEPLAWRDRGGARMTSRFAGTGDRRQVQWQRDVAVPAGPTLWRREAWTDYLAWTPPVGLVDAPVRATPVGTQQHLVAQWRRRAAALVAAGPRAVTPAVLAEAGLHTSPL